MSEEMRVGPPVAPQPRRFWIEDRMAEICKYLHELVGMNSYDIEVMRGHVDELHALAYQVEKSE